jgi:hypothetical protein
VGFLGDLVYFGPRLGPGRAMRLAAAKAAKGRRKRRVAASLRAPDDDASLLGRLGLPADPDARRAVLLELWGPAAASPEIAPRLPGDEAARGDPGHAASPAVRAADAVLAGGQRLFGDEIEVGWPPDWTWRGEGWPEAERFAADRRTTWEIQRLQGILPLAAAAGLPPEEGGERWAGAYAEALLDFARRHPAPDGIAWESALEVGLRLVALGQGLPQIVRTRAFREAELPLLRMLDAHARRLASDLSLDKVVRGNHLLGELAGLLVAGDLLPPARAAWWGRVPVADLLDAEILAQFHPDGVNVEQSLPYEKFVLEFLTVAGAYRALRGGPFPPAVRERLAASADHLERVTGPDGILPRVGDVDNARGAMWGDHNPLDPAETVRRLRRLVGEPRSPAETPVLPLTPRPAGPRRGTVRLFPDGGHAVLTGFGGDFLFLRGGPFGWGIPGPAAHGHADRLAPVLTIAGEPLLVDPGTFGYAVGEGLRDAFRTAAAHGGLVVEPDPGPVPAGTFRWRRLRTSADLTTREVDGGVVLEGKVAWGRRGALRWHRSIRYDHLDASWLIEDRVAGSDDRTLEWVFRFSPRARIEESGEAGVLRVGLPSGRTVTFRMTPPGDVRVGTGWVAPRYGKRVEAPVVRRRLPRGIHASLVEIRRGSEPRDEESP